MNTQESNRSDRPYRIEDQYFLFKVLWKVDQSRQRDAKESHFKCITQKKPKKSSHFIISSKARWEQTLKDNSPWRFLHQYNQEGPGKPTEEYFDESMTEKEKKRNNWGKSCFEYSSHGLKQDGFPQSRLVEIAPMTVRQSSRELRLCRQTSHTRKDNSARYAGYRFANY